PPTVLADDQRRPFRLAVRDGTLYWTDNLAGTIMKMPATGGTPTMLASSPDNPSAIAVADGTLYWSTFNPGTIRSMPLAAPGVVTTVVPDTFAANLFVRNGTLYWSNTEIIDGSSTIFALPARGRAPTPLASTPGSDAAVADAVNLYWTDEVSATIRKAPLAGGEPTILVEDQLGANGIAIDDANIYWITSIPNGRVMKLAK